MARLLSENLKALSTDKHVAKELWNKDAIHILDVCESNSFFKAVNESRDSVKNLNTVFRAHGLPSINIDKKSHALAKEISNFADCCGVKFSADPTN